MKPLRSEMYIKREYIVERNIDIWKFRLDDTIKTFNIVIFISASIQQGKTHHEI